MLVKFLLGRFLALMFLVAMELDACQSNVNLVNVGV